MDNNAHGKWVLTKDSEGNFYWQCSNCNNNAGYSLPAKTEYKIPYPRIKYCSNCGYDMRI